MNGDISEKSKRILKGMELVYRRLVKFKQLKKSPLVVSVNGRVERIQPDKIRPTARYHAGSKRG